MRLIDADKLQDYFWDNRSKLFQAKDCRIAIDNAPTVEAIPVTEKAFEMFEADYETRLKADLEAILVELQLKIEEMSGLVTEIHGEEWNEINVIHSQDVLSFIQQKINELKGEKHEV